MSRRFSGNNGDHVSDLHVVTENGEQCFMWRSNQLSYIAQDRQELPIVLANKFGPLATKLDLSYNNLISFNNINQFVNLNELILDNNCLEDQHLNFKQNLRLKTLSLNKNKLLDLYKLINSIKTCFPNMEFLSLIGNPLCPNLSRSDCALDSPLARDQRHYTSVGDTLSALCSTDVLVDGKHTNNDLYNSVNTLQNSTSSTNDREYNYQKYRHFIIYHLPNLRFLDSSPVSSSERDEALRRHYRLGNSYELSRVYSRRDTYNNLSSDASTLTNNAQEACFQLDIMSDYSDMATEGSTLQANKSSRGVFSRLTYKYTGKNSEGNRFIKNHDL